MMEEALALGQTELGRFDLLPRLTFNAGYVEKSDSLATTSRDAVTGQSSDAHPTYSNDRWSKTLDLGLSWNILDFGVSYFTAHQNADRVLVAAERRRKAVHTLTARCGSFSGVSPLIRL